MYSREGLTDGKPNDARYFEEEEDVMERYDRAYMDVGTCIICGELTRVNPQMKCEICDSLYDEPDGIEGIDYIK